MEDIQEKYNHLLQQNETLRIPFAKRIVCKNIARSKTVHNHHRQRHRMVWRHKCSWLCNRRGQCDKSGRQQTCQ